MAPPHILATYTGKGLICPRTLGPVLSLTTPGVPVCPLPPPHNCLGRYL